MIAFLLDCLGMGFAAKQFEIHERDEREGDLNFRAFFLGSTAVIQFVTQFIYVMVVYMKQPAASSSSSSSTTEDPLPEQAMETTTTPKKNPKMLVFGKSESFCIEA